MTDAAVRGSEASAYALGTIAPAPLAERSRIASLDVLRGVALLGILVMNIQSFSMPGVAYMNPTAYGDLGGANRLVWLASHIFVDQKMMAIFTMLFGAGLLVFASSKGDPLSARRLHRRRMLWLALFGILHAHLLWYGDILFAYAIGGLIAFRWRDRAPRDLLVRGLVIVSITTVISLLFGWSMRFWPPEAMADFIEKNWQPSAPTLARELDAYRGGWLEQAPVRSTTALMFETMFMLMFGLWRVWGVMLIGMALLKTGILDGSRPSGYYARLAGVGFAFGVPIVVLGAWLNIANEWRAEYSFGFGGQFNYWGSLLVALGWIGLVLWAFTSGALGRLADRLAAVGRMAFSNYILQTVLCTTLFYGHGLGLFGSVSRVQQIGIVTAVWVVQLIVSPLWLARYRYGPLEWIWRSLTYRRWQPFARSATPTSA